MPSCRLSPLMLLLLAAPLCAQTLAVQLVDPAGRGQAMNGAGSIVGHRLVYPCAVPGQCAPRRDATVWTAAGARLALPGASGSVVVVPSALGDDGLVVGTLSDSATMATAGVWRPTGGAYVFEALGNLGLQQSWATGLDAAGRVVGYATTPFVQTRPFVWTAATGLVDLVPGGAPAERIHSVSPGGRVLTDGHAYPLDDPGAAVPLPAAPPGSPAFLPPVGFNLRTNDQGDLAGFLIAAAGPNAYFLHRWRAATGTWQRLLENGIAPQSGLPLGVARLDDAGGLLATAGQPYEAAGPDGLPTPLAARLSPAYPANALQSAFWRDDAGTVGAQMALGGASRLVRLVPVAACSGACLRVASVGLTARVVRASPRASCGQPQCVQASASVTVTDAAGNPVPRARVQLRFMNTYTLDSAVTASTNAAGVATLKQLDFVGMGTVSVLVEAVSRSGWAWDRTVGQLTAAVVPQ